MLDFESLSPGIQEKIEGLAKLNGWDLNRTMDELVIEGIAMGGLTMAVRPKATLVPIKGPPNLLGQKGPAKDPN
ncbi:hypothetical protein [Pseudomonas chlororaphis]|uniref:hypothetical protein n=1 Tax=Pseudomonas chlororaphis TaxID=587753 RepID=UPI000BE38226|nr:hypothetical protein [Pseudomonas chlororaphis]